MISTDTLSPRCRSAVADLLERTVAHDGVSPLDEAARFALEGGEALHILVRGGEHLTANPSHEPDDAPVPDDAPAPVDSAAPKAPAASEAPTQDCPGPVIGYASVLPDGTVQGMVDPAHRRRGIGTQIARAALAAHDAPALWVHGGLEGSLQFAQVIGVHEARRLLSMRRDLTLPLPARPTLAPGSLDGVVFRAARVPEDAAEWVAVNAAAFAHHPEQGALTLEDFTRRTEQPWFCAEDLLIAREGAGEPGSAPGSPPGEGSDGERPEGNAAEQRTQNPTPDEGAMLGFVWLKRVPGEIPEVYAVATAPQAQGRGVANALLRRALERLIAAGEQAVDLYVEADAEAALALYERWAFETIGCDVQLRPAAPAAAAAQHGSEGVSPRDGKEAA